MKATMELSSIHKHLNKIIQIKTLILFSSQQQNKKVFKDFIHLGHIEGI